MSASTRALRSCRTDASVSPSTIKNTTAHNDDTSVSDRPVLARDIVNIAASNATTPSIRRQRQRMSDDQLERLLSAFAQSTHPTRAQKQALADELGLDFKTVNIWFQNKRQTSKRHSGRTGSRRSSSPHSDEICGGPTSSNQDTSDRGSTQIACAVQRPATLSTATRYPPLLPRYSPLTVDDISYDQNAGVLNVFNQHSDTSTEVSHLQDAVTTQPSSSLARQISGQHVNACDLWRLLSSSPPLRSTYSCDPSPSPELDPEVELLSLDFTTGTRKRSRMLTWACTRTSKRRRLQGDIDRAYSEDAAAIETEEFLQASLPDRLATRVQPLTFTPSFLAPVTSIPREYCAIFSPDVINGASMLLKFKYSRMVS